MTASMALNCLPYNGFGHFTRPSQIASPNIWQYSPVINQQFYSAHNFNTFYSAVQYSPNHDNGLKSVESFNNSTISPVSSTPHSVGSTIRTSPLQTSSTFCSYYQYYGPSQSTNSQQRSSQASQENVVFPEPDTVELPEVDSTSGTGDNTSSSLSSLSSNDEDDKLPIATLMKSGKLKKIAKKKKKSKKDPNEPEKPVPAYALFFRDTQPKIKSQKSDATFGEISKIVAALWDNLDADKKADYKKRAESAKKDYLKKLAAYKAQLLSTEVPEPIKKETSPEKMDEEPRRTFTHPPNRCIREGCNNISIDDPRWDRQFCSTECVVRHCREAFQGWVAMQQEKDCSDNHLLSIS